MKNLSIITDFGCPFNCSFCITNSQQTKKSFVLNQFFEDDLSKYIIENDITRLSISGGGEPLFVHNKNIEEFYEKIFQLAKNLKISLHVHTNTFSPNLNIYKFNKVVVSINKNNYLKKFLNWNLNITTRFVHVSDGSDLELIKTMISHLPINSQFTVKQLDDTPGCDFSEIKSYVNSIQNCKFLGSGDYNIYYNLNDGKFYDVFKNIKFII